MGSVNILVKVFCWLGWSEPSSKPSVGGDGLGQVAEGGTGPEPELGGHHRQAKAPRATTT